MASGKRRSISARAKLVTLNELETPDDLRNSPSLRSTAKRRKIQPSKIHQYKKDKHKLLGVASRSEVVWKTWKIGAGRAPAYPEIDGELVHWVVSQNSLGLVIKDKYLKMQAAGITEGLDTSGFETSNGYLWNFKKRHNLARRAQTSRRELPPDAKQQAEAFISEVNSIVKTKRILLVNILNFDQVPRYFDATSKKTLTVNPELQRCSVRSRGTREA